MTRAQEGRFRPHIPGRPGEETDNRANESLRPEPLPSGLPFVRIGTQGSGQIFPAGFRGQLMAIPFRAPFIARGIRAFAFGSGGTREVSVGLWRAETIRKSGFRAGLFAQSPQQTISVTPGQRYFPFGEDVLIDPDSYFYFFGFVTDGNLQWEGAASGAIAYDDAATTSLPTEWGVGQGGLQLTLSTSVSSAGAMLVSRNGERLVT